MILDCYRLAAYYHVDPRVFLDMPISEVTRHRQRTAQLMREHREAQRATEGE
jgi:hypothetical protein